MFFNEDFLRLFGVGLEVYRVYGVHGVHGVIRVIRVKHFLSHKVQTKQEGGRIMKGSFKLPFYPTYVQTKTRTRILHNTVSIPHR